MWSLSYSTLKCNLNTCHGSCGGCALIVILSHSSAIMPLCPFSLPYSVLLSPDSVILFSPFQAAEDARRQMGNRRFYDQMLMDACHHHQLKVTDEVDVTTMKEYMQVRFTACVCVHSWSTFFCTIRAAEGFVIWLAFDKFSRQHDIGNQQ